MPILLLGRSISCMVKKLRQFASGTRMLKPGELFIKPWVLSLLKTVGERRRTSLRSSFAKRPSFRITLKTWFYQVLCPIPGTNSEPSNIRRFRETKSNQD